MRSRLILVWLLLLFTIGLPAQQAALPPAERIADGVTLYRLEDPSLLDPPGPVAGQALRLEPRRVSLEIARATGEPARETLETIAARRPGVIAAINAGFFSLATGKPTDLLKIAGEIIKGTARPR